MLEFYYEMTNKIHITYLTREFLCKKEFNRTLIYDINKHTETNMLRGYPLSAVCVRKSDDSRNSAIRIAYRISLRSSSLWEPRYPSLKIFFKIF